MLWGRVVYEMMEGHWPAVARDPEAPRLHRDWARKLDAKPKCVVSGSPTLARELHRLGLIDEYRLVVHPKVAGHGPVLFVDWRAAGLTLVDAKRFRSGVVALRYRRE